MGHQGADEIPAWKTPHRCCCCTSPCADNLESPHAVPLVCWSSRRYSPRRCCSFIGRAAAAHGSKFGIPDARIPARQRFASFPDALKRLETVSYRNNMSTKSNPGLGKFLSFSAKAHADRFHHPIRQINGILMWSPHGPMFKVGAIHDGGVQPLVSFP